MIARIWHGFTRREDADIYESMLKPELLPGVAQAHGYIGSYLLRRQAASEVEFITIVVWDSLDSIRALIGDDYETAIIPDERRKYLLRYDATAAHYDINSVHGMGVALN